MIISEEMDKLKIIYKEKLQNFQKEFSDLEEVQIENFRMKKTLNVLNSESNLEES